jgi:hypothetical protein
MSSLGIQMSWCDFKPTSVLIFVSFGLFSTASCVIYASLCTCIVISLAYCRQTARLILTLLL